MVDDDPRTIDALCGYVVQAYHYPETGEAFCDVEGCRLYDAHEQATSIESQLRHPAFCGAHASLYDV